MSTAKEQGYKVSVNCKANILHEAKKHTNQLNKGDEADDTHWFISDPFTLSSLSTLTGRTNLHIIAAVMVIANGALSSNPAWHLPCSL
jgi:hypothetical protein